MRGKRKTPKPHHGLQAPRTETSLAPSLSFEIECDKGRPALGAALEYVRRGWAILPLCPKSKLPYAELLPLDRKGDPSWKLLAAEPATEAEVQGWFRQDPNCNIGIITGAPSGGLVVVDVDQTDKAKGLHLPPTACAVTSRGAHYLYTSSQPVATVKASWGEIRAEGAYVAAVPSLHPSGLTYTWADFCAPGEIDLAELPQDLLDAAAQDQRDRAASRKRASKVSDNQYISYRLPSEQSSVSFDHREWVTREDVALSILKACGAPDPRLGKAMRCVLPGHEERRASASLYRMTDNTITYRDWHCKGAVEWLSLSEVYASVTTGKVMQLGAGEKTVWLIRALIDCGFVKGPGILAPKLPADAKPIVRDVFEGFKRLVAVRQLYNGAIDGSMFSWRFAASWCGRSERHVGQAMGWLLQHGYLHKSGESAGKQRTALFVFGTPREGEMQ